MLSVWFSCHFDMISKDFKIISLSFPMILYGFDMIFMTLICFEFDFISSSCGESPLVEGEVLCCSALLVWATIWPFSSFLLYGVGVYSFLSALIPAHLSLTSNSCLTVLSLWCFLYFLSCFFISVLMSLIV